MLGLEIDYREYKEDEKHSRWCYFKRKKKKNRVSSNVNLRKRHSSSFSPSAVSFKNIDDQNQIYNLNNALKVFTQERDIKNRNVE